MNPEQRIVALEQRIAQLERLFINHQHRGFDRTKPLASVASFVAGGLDGYVQYNDNGVIAGDAFLRWDKEARTITIDTGSDGRAIAIPVQGSGTIYFYIQHSSDNNGYFDLSSGVAIRVAGKNVVLAPSGSGNDGFVHIPTSAGAPTGTPTEGNGAIVYDTLNNDLYVYNGAWKKVHLA